MVARRAHGEPLQYVLGRWGFRTLDLLVDRRVLIPRPETEVVAGLAIDALAALDRPGVAVDLGTGSGAIALSLAAERWPHVEVWATDVSPDALAVARANLAGLGRRAAVVRLLEGTGSSALPGDLRGRVDVIVSNPPYVPADAPLPAGGGATGSRTTPLVPGPTGWRPSSGSWPTPRPGWRPTACWSSRSARTRAPDGDAAGDRERPAATPPSTRISPDATGPSSPVE